MQMHTRMHACPYSRLPIYARMPAAAPPSHLPARIILDDAILVVRGRTVRRRDQVDNPIVPRAHVVLGDRAFGAADATELAIELAHAQPPHRVRHVRLAVEEAAVKDDDRRPLGPRGKVGHAALLPCAHAHRGWMGGGL